METLDLRREQPTLKIELPFTNEDFDIKKLKLDESLVSEKIDQIKYDSEIEKYKSWEENGVDLILKLRKVSITESDDFQKKLADLIFKQKAFEFGVLQFQDKEKILNSLMEEKSVSVEWYESEIERYRKMRAEPGLSNPVFSLQFIEVLCVDVNREKFDLIDIYNMQTVIGKIRELQERPDLKKKIE